MKPQPDPNKPDRWEKEARLIYAIIVAGKSAKFADRATPAFLRAIRKTLSFRKTKTPFAMMRCLPMATIEECARHAKTGNYGKLARACYEIANKQIDLDTVTPEKLETIHGIGPKTSRFFIMWIRPGETFAALDVHVLRWLRANGYPNAPKATPQSTTKYRDLEISFINEANKRGLTARELDLQIWEAGAKYNQQTSKAQP